MTHLLVLDASVVGAITNPKQTNEIVRDCQIWFRRSLARLSIFVLPEIADYEIRRELLRGKKINGLKKLDELKSAIYYYPIDSEIMLTAAQLWAESRQRGMPTADARELDGDVILAAQAIQLQSKGYEVTIVTTNVGHLAQFVTASHWQDLSIDRD
ncbi:PIN domain-containing protein [Chamaesiphon sp. OTE_75_metabat_556]|jgi:predicted nucleic acid-binding protein|uniref:PIN domain-containing protein n=1 Tax=Chamaesiphon sp. OTE_75_metabat_556 TaxID=2964692 RepID=UPI00286A3834|nr:PIN domain-containing protein [Chamaesiphon sp. OTE_75_metabat_556]